MKRILVLVLVLTLMVLMISCSRSYDPVSNADQSDSSCENCHLSKDRLIATTAVDTTSGSGDDTGEG